MAGLRNPITSCLKKNMAENTKDSAVSDKKETDSVPQTTAQQSLLWKVSSGLYGIGSGAVGMGIGSVKWAASTTYNVGSSVVSVGHSAISKVGTPLAKAKPKNKKE